MKKIVLAGIGMGAMALAFAAKDPVIMTVNGVDVPKSEFEYLYNKNSQQQINPQSLDDYVEMFKLYKMKVADARAEGLDTLASFRKESEQYRHELAEPLLADSAFLNSLVDKAYERSKEEVEAYHIMLFKTRDPKQNEVLRQRADSLRQAIIGGSDYSFLAKRFSQDRGSASKGGRMGWITSGNYPLAFEDAAFSLAEGQISDVVESPVGFHILKGGKHRPARGKVRVSHILKLTQGLDSVGVKNARAAIDSIYNNVAHDPGAFEKTAGQVSDDKGSARQGGMLPWFGAGEMVEAFDSVAFSLSVGEISAPFESPYGFHIVKKLDQKGIPSVAEIKPAILQRISSPQDPRYNLVRDNQINRFAKKFKGSVADDVLKDLCADASSLGLDSAFVAKWTAAPYASKTLCRVGNSNYSAGDFVKSYESVKYPASQAAADLLTDNFKAYYKNKLTIAAEDDLLKNNSDYSNLLKEYVDGSLLYEVSLRKVWDRAAKDTEGLEKYFQDNRANYTWTEPHAKGFLVQAINDSVANLVRERAAQLQGDSVPIILRKEFYGKAIVDRVLVSKGTNAMVDYLMFGGPEAKPSNSKYTVMFMLNPRIINRPEEVSDVKGLVTSDYQNEFQAAWEAELRRKYPVTVNEKVLKKVKPISNKK